MQPTNTNGLPEFTHFGELKQRKIVLSWQGLRNLQTTQNFPLGRLISPSRGSGR
jgi:hypothetical protein